MEITLHNKNFISPLMTKGDVKRAFKTHNIIPLIEQGYVQRYYQYFKPLPKLSLLICPEEIEIKDIKSLNKKKSFWLKDIIDIFECTKEEAKLILELYFFRTGAGKYRRKDSLNELLAEGETILKLKGEN